MSDTRTFGPVGAVTVTTVPTPARLAELTGPTSGTIELPVTIDRGPKRVYAARADCSAPNAVLRYEPQKPGRRHSPRRTLRPVGPTRTSPQGRAVGQVASP